MLPEDIFIQKANELSVLFETMENQSVLLTVLLSLERQQQTFLHETNEDQEYYAPLQNSIKLCMDVLWEYFFHTNPSTQQRENYRNTIDNLTDSFEMIDLGVEIYYSRPLIETLFQCSFLLSEQTQSQDCAYAALSALETIFDYCMDTLKCEEIECLKQEPHIVEELGRIDYDISIAAHSKTDKETITNLRQTYQSLGLIGW